VGIYAVYLGEGMAKTLWKELVYYAYKHNLPCRGFSAPEILSMLKANGLPEDEKEELKRIASKHGFDWNEIPLERNRLLEW